MIPQVKTYLPELSEFISDLATQVQHKQINDWQSFAQTVRQFFTPTMMDKVNNIIPKWNEMASYGDQKTLIHVISVLVALELLPEYKNATDDQQQQMMWTVLFHDVAKVIYPDKHDYLHAFRSAMVAGKALANIGFSVTPAYRDLIDEWVKLVYQATLFQVDIDDTIPDNRQLPQIINGINTLYGADNPAVSIIKAVLFHLAIETDPKYPTVSPLTEDEIKAYIDPTTYPIFKVMMLVDMDGRTLFDGKERDYHRQLTLKAFDRITGLINL